MICSIIAKVPCYGECHDPSTPGCLVLGLAMPDGRPSAAHCVLIPGDNLVVSADYVETTTITDVPCDHLAVRSARGVEEERGTSTQNQAQRQQSMQNEANTREQGANERNNADQQGANSRQESRQNYAQNAQQSNQK